MAIKASSIIDKLKELHAQLDSLQESFVFLRTNLIDGKLKEDAPNGAAYDLAKALSKKAATLLTSLDSDVVGALLANDSWDTEVV